MNINGVMYSGGECFTRLYDDNGLLFSVRCRGFNRGITAAQIVATILEIDEITEPKTNVQ